MGLARSRRISRILRVAAASGIVLSALAVSGCLDVVQYISGSGTDIDVYFRLTFQKSVFELASAFGDEPQDLDQMFAEEFNLNEDEVLKELPAGVTAEFNMVNSDSEFGFELMYTASRVELGRLSESEAAFVPRVTPWGMTIPLSEGGGSEESDEFAGALLGSAKYRLMISKMLVSRISDARIIAGEESHPVTITDLPDIWLLEFPIGAWYSSDGTSRVEVVF